VSLAAIAPAQRGACHGGELREAEKENQPNAELSAADPTPTTSLAASAVPPSESVHPRSAINWLKRRHAYSEIVNTEEDYIEDLHFLNELSAACLRSRWLSAKQAHRLFSNVSSLLQLHRRIFANVQRSTSIAEAFSASLDEFYVYHSYVNSYDQAIEYLDYLKASHTDGGSFLIR
jgi:RhoGEF domain